MIKRRSFSHIPTTHTHTHKHYTSLFPNNSTNSPSKPSNLSVRVLCVMEQNTSPITSSPSMHKNSHTISKTKPKIRIIHIFAPEIIKTDASNFRELVQRLTGKPPTEDQNPMNTKLTKKKSGDVRITSSKKKIDMRAGFHAAGAGGLMRERIKGEEEIWRGANTGGGFLGGFQEFENGLLQEINVVDDDDHQFPFMEGTTQIDDRVYGESQAA